MVVTLLVAAFMLVTVCRTSAEADDCLAVAEAICAISSLERPTESMMLRSATPARSARVIPSLVSAAPALAVSTASVVSCCTWRMTSPISLVASTERSASLRTSSATTAKPRPASPARAASMAAFRASRLVWSAISSMTSRILPISWLRLPRPVMTRAVFSMVSEIVFMPEIGPRHRLARRCGRRRRPCG